MPPLSADLAVEPQPASIPNGYRGRFECRQALLKGSSLVGIQFTQGRFVFLTYAGPTNGGAPGDETTHHVEDYSVENLDDLVVRLVEEELAYQDSGLTRVQ